MGNAEKERLNQILNSHLNTIHDSMQMLDQEPDSSLDKVSWGEVVTLGDQVSKQATIVGMIWVDGKPGAKAIEENMATFFNTLQGFLLLSHGSTMGAGPTLSSFIHASVKQVVDCCFKLMMETVPSFGSRTKDFKLVVPQLAGAVWEACSALKKTPATNITAIGRAMTQVALSLKDVLREMEELNVASSILTDEASSVPSPEGGSGLPDDNESSDIDDLGNDLSPEEMKVAQLASGVVTETLAVVKELIRTITGLLKQEKPDDGGDFVDSLEKLLKLSQEISRQIDEIGASLYPPQEVSNIKAALEKISSIVSEVLAIVESFGGSSENFVLVCNGLKSSIKQMESELDGPSTADIAAKMQNVALCN